VLAATAKAPSSAETATASLEVVLVSAAGVDPTLSKRITSWFNRDRIRVRVQVKAVLEPSAILRPEGDATLHAWVALEAARARLYFTRHDSASQSESYLLRELELEHGLDEIGAERLAEVLHLSALALLEGSMNTPRTEVERSLGEPPAPTPAPAAATPPASKTELALERELSRPKKTEATPASSRVEIGLGYGLALHSAEGLWHGPRASLAWRSRAGLGVAALGQAGLPATHTLDGIDVRIHSLAFAAVGRYAHPMTLRWAVELCAGPGLTWVHYTPERAGAAVALGSSGNEWRPTLTAGAALAFGASRLRAALSVELELSLARTRYELEAGRGALVVAEPSPFAPRFALEARY